MISRNVRVTNRLGLHARAAARFVQTANRYRSRITLGRDTRSMDGKSILGILLLRPNGLFGRTIARRV